MLIKITRWWDGTTLHELESTDLRTAVIELVGKSADLRDADLRDADLRGADLRGAKNIAQAKNLRLPTGEMWDEYLRDVVPALLTAGGKTLESFQGHWQCHTWDNCPMAHAHSTSNLEGVPALLRPRAVQFIQFFDGRQIPWEVIQRVIDARAASHPVDGTAT